MYTEASILRSRKASSGVTANGEPQELTSFEKAHEDQWKLLSEITYMESLMKDQLEVFEKSTGEAGRLPPIEWTTFSPPRTYHPESFTNSLEDTPDRYQQPHLKDSSIPISLRNHATLPDKIGDFTKQSLSEDTVLKNLWVWDIRATGLAEDSSGFTWEVRPAPLAYSTLDQNKPGTEGRLLLWALYDSVSMLL
jgi:hypothetical protein